MRKGQSCSRFPRQQMAGGGGGGAAPVAPAPLGVGLTEVGLFKYFLLRLVLRCMPVNFQFIILCQCFLFQICNSEYDSGNGLHEEI